MQYQEKVNFTKKALELKKNGNSKEDIDNYLKNEGVKAWDIKKINHSIDKYLKNKYHSTIKSYMLNNSLKSKLSEFDEIDADLFEKIQHEIIGEIKANSQRRVRAMLKEKNSTEEIIEEVTNHFFCTESVYEAIELENKKTVEKRSQRDKGIGLIILGVILSFASRNIIPDKMILFHGVILYGGYMVFKSREIY